MTKEAGNQDQDFSHVVQTAVHAATAEKDAELEKLRAELAARDEALKAASAEKDEAERKVSVAAHAMKGKRATGNASRASNFPRVKIVVAEASSETDPVDVFVAVQGRAYTIKRGEPVTLPPEVVEVLENAIGGRMIPKKDGGFERVVVKRFPFQIVDSESHRNYQAWKDFHEQSRKPVEVAPEVEDV